MIIENCLLFPAPTRVYGIKQSRPLCLYIWYLTIADFSSSLSLSYREPAFRPTSSDEAFAIYCSLKYLC